ncbi:hypothetical protein BH20ACT2_BH20ACT2_20190 [soil metagenome]
MEQDGRHGVGDAARLAAVAATGLAATPPEEPFDRLVRLAATVLGTPSAFLTIVDDKRSWFKACVGVPAGAERSTPVEMSFCQYVIASDEPLIVDDARCDPRTRDNPAIASLGVAAWAGFPVRAPTGEVLGTFCAVDNAVRHWSEHDIDILRTLAASASTEVALRAAIVDEAHARADAEVAASRAALLADAGARLSSSLDDEITLTNLAELVVPRLADWCGVDLLQPDGGIRRLIVTQADPALREVATALEEFGPDPHGPSPIMDVIRTGESIFAPEVTDDMLAGGVESAEHLAIMKSLDVRSVLIVPLTARGRTIGALTLIAVGDRRPYGQSDLSLACELAERAALAVDNALLHQAVTFQAALLEAGNEATVDAILVVSPTGEMLSFNQRFVELWPIPDEVMATRSDQAALRSVLDKLVDPEAFMVRVNELYEHHDRSSRDELALLGGRIFDRYGSPLTADDGTYLGWAWRFRDITDDRRRSRALMESGERFATLARTLQQSLLPPSLPDVPGIEVAARYSPAESGVEVVGDFYDVFQAARSWGVVMGDVCGKGSEAAAVTALARYTIRAAAMRTRVPSRILATLNEALLQQRPDDERFVTAVYVTVRQSASGVNLTLASAGHLPPLLRRHDGELRTVTRPALPAGLFADIALSDVRLELRPGDTLVLYTDGVTEARRGEEEFGLGRLEEIVESAHELEVSGLAAAIEEAVEKFSDGSHRDDRAILVLRVPRGS